VTGYLDSIPKLGSSGDTFHIIMPRAIKRCKLEFSDLERLYDEAVKEYTKTAELYGEAANIMSPDQFFDYVQQFIQLLQDTYAEIEVERDKEERAKKKRRSERKKRKLQEKKKENEKQQNNNSRQRNRSLRRPTHPINMMKKNIN